MSSSLGNCADALDNHSTRINKMEEQLAGFSNPLNTFQQALQTDVANKLKTFEKRILDSIQTQLTISNTTPQETTVFVCKNCSQNTSTSNLSTTSSTETLLSNRISQLEDTLSSVSDQAVNKHRHSIAEERAKQLKRSVLADWNDSINSRRRGHWNYILNRNKQTLYRRWQQEDPTYLPLKFRPRTHPTTDSNISAIKHALAYQNYSKNIEEMAVYELTHQQRYIQIDNDMAHRINTLTDDDLVRSKLLHLWSTDTADQEARSIQIWNKKERFLIRKKYEETSTDHDNRTTPLQTQEPRHKRQFN